MEAQRRTWAEISLDAIRHNYGALRRFYGKTGLMTVLKGDAYGHGISGIVPACEGRTDWYAVATMEEGRAIRQCGSNTPVLLFGPVPPGQMVEAARLGLTFTVGSLEYGRLLAEKLEAADLRADVQLKLDTGLNRTGFRWREGREKSVLEELSQLYGLNRLTVTGVYSHLACPESDAAEDEAFTEVQLRRFRTACAAMEAGGLPTGLRHICSSGGSIKHRDAWLDMVRTGMLVYGQCDTRAHARELGLLPALCWKACVTQVEPLARGEWVSYGRTFRAERDMLLGVVSCGYADGYRRSYQSWGRVLVGGQEVRTLGRVCMDYLLVDLSDVKEPKPGMEVVLLGCQGQQEISVIDLAEAVGSVCGEVTAAISPRVARVYR